MPVGAAFIVIGCGLTTGLQIPSPSILGAALKNGAALANTKTGAATAVAVAAVAVEEDEEAATAAAATAAAAAASASARAFLIRKLIALRLAQY